VLDHPARMIEITGAAPGNKGAWQMLLAVQADLADGPEPPQFCMEPGRDYPARAGAGLWQVYPAMRLRNAFDMRLRLLRAAALGSLRSAPALRRYGMVRLRDIDALVDVSGSVFSDHWPIGWTEAFLELARNYRRRGAPVLLLPQMFGPYRDPARIKAIRELVATCALVFARDRFSLQNLTAAAGAQPHVRWAPDITIFHDPPPELRQAAAAERERNGHYACLVPNARILDQGRDAWGGCYVERMAATARWLQARGLRARIVLHETKGQDRPLADAIRQAAGDPAPELVYEADPWRLKALIGASRLLVASRFHSLVAALAAGVPAVALGWAHKYDGLLADFDAQELQHRPADSGDQLLEMLAPLLDDAAWNRWHGRLAAARARMAPANAEMWRDVRAALGLAAPAANPAP